jgi:hypothetical protein
LLEKQDAANRILITTKLFWPFSSSPPEKATTSAEKASTATSVHASVSASSKSAQIGRTSTMEVKAIRQAQEVMRKLVMADKKAAHQVAEDMVLQTVNDH